MVQLTVGPRGRKITFTIFYTKWGILTFRTEFPMTLSAMSNVNQLNLTMKDNDVSMVVLLKKRSLLAVKGSGEPTGNIVVYLSYYGLENGRVGGPPVGSPLPLTASKERFFNSIGGVLIVTLI